MGLYLNQLPQTEVARLKAELAETLIANFCYPRFYDYRIGMLRTRPVDRAKRQEVWQYLNAVDFNVWGRVDIDSPDFQRQVERLFIHFVQRNRSFFGEQGRKRMADVRSLIASCSTALADGLRGHLNGQHGNPPFGSPRAVSSWATTNITGRAEVSWEQILSGTMLLQQQLQEVRGEVRPSSTPVPTTPAASAPGIRASNGAMPARRPRPSRSVAGGAVSNGNVPHEEDAVLWPATGNRAAKPVEESAPAPSAPVLAREDEFAQAEVSAFPASADVSPTLPLPLGKVEGAPTVFQPAAPVEASPVQPARVRRARSAELSPAAPFVAPPPSGPLARQVSQPLPAPAVAPVSVVTPASTPQQPVPASVVHSTLEAAVKQAENGTALTSDEDVVIFEQMRHQLIIWLKVEAVRSGIEPGSQNTFQLVDTLRRQDGVDTARLQVVSTLLNMCDQIISGGRATLFDYKQAMMFYLMHTRRGH
jgi:hypothetical protein